MALLFVVETRPASSQTVARNTTVRVTLTDRRVIEGRLIESDADGLVLAADDPRTRIGRDQITAIARRSERSGTFARRSAIASGIVGGLWGAAGFYGMCQGETNGGCAGAFLMGGAAGGVFAGAVGGVTGAVVGSFFHRWTPIAPSVAVIDVIRTGIQGVESCAGGMPVHIATGFSSTGGVAARLAVPMRCTDRVAWGLEIGSIGKRSGRSMHVTYDPPPDSDYSRQSSVTADRTDAKVESFVGTFAEVSLGAIRFNPRLVTSLGAYRRHVDWRIQTVSRNRDYVVTADTSTTGQYSTWNPGVGVGLGAATPVWQHVSVGAEVRGHFVVGGNSHLAATMALSGRYRP